MTPKKLLKTYPKGITLKEFAKLTYNMPLKQVQRLVIGCMRLARLNGMRQGFIVENRERFKNKNTFSSGFKGE